MTQTVRAPNSRAGREDPMTSAHGVVRTVGAIKPSGWHAPMRRDVLTQTKADHRTIDDCVDPVLCLPTVIENYVGNVEEGEGRPHWRLTDIPDATVTSNAGEK
ncbi:hypothetical protein MRX96_025884 [Rhipicephalus microplus]